MKTPYFRFNSGLSAVVRQIILALTCGVCIQGAELLCARHFEVGSRDLIPSN